MKNNKKYKLLCPSPESFSGSIKKTLSKRYDCKFSKMNNIKFNKICHKYEIILMRFNNTLKYLRNTKIKFIMCPTTATEHIDSKFFFDDKIKIFTLKNYTKFLQNIRATIEFTIFLILYYLRNNKKNPQKKKSFGNETASEIYKKNIGIIGYGRIGKKVHKILKSFNANLKIYEKKKIKKNKKLNFVSLNKLLTSCEIILVHIPLNYQNEKFLNASRLNLIKKGAVIINTSRGNVIDENYIFSLVKKKKLKYFTDVISNKALSNERNTLKKIKNYKNFYYSGHIAGLTRESIEKTDWFVYKNFLKNIKSKY